MFPGGSQQQHLLVASSLVGKLQEKLQKAAAAAGGAGGESAVVASFKGSALAGSVVSSRANAGLCGVLSHPFSAPLWCLCVLTRMLFAASARSAVTR